MPIRLRNRPLTTGEVPQFVAQADRHIANMAAKIALGEWYRIGYNRARKDIVKMQIYSNFEIVASIPGWQEQKGTRNGYIMLTSLWSGESKPVILKLNYKCHPAGGITYRSLHQQVRKALQLEPKVFLRMCPYRPWYRHMRICFPVPEHAALCASDAQCRHLLGTTLLYYKSEHLTD